VEVSNTMNPGSWLRKHLEEGDPDLLRSMLGAFVDQLMDAEVNALCNAGYGEITPDRVNSRNGYRTRDFDTRVGALELAIPKLRSGSYFPDWLVEPRRRAEGALVTVVGRFPSASTSPSG
jgi:putative transposase